MDLKQEHLISKENQESGTTYRSVLISFEVDAKANELLTISANRAGRTKRKEAKIRLRDHLLKYTSNLEYEDKDAHKD